LLISPGRPIWGKKLKLVEPAALASVPAAAATGASWPASSAPLDFQKALSEDPELTRVLSAQEITACFSPESHLRYVDTIFDRVFGPGPSARD
jgi:adenylosuccinate lyase